MKNNKSFLSQCQSHEGKCMERVKHIFLKNDIYVSEDNNQKLQKIFFQLFVYGILQCHENCLLPSHIIYLFCLQKTQILWSSYLIIHLLYLHFKILHPSETKEEFFEYRNNMSIHSCQFYSYHIIDTILFHAYFTSCIIDRYSILKEKLS